ncbi:acyl-CoA carboxylase epsilon subunit [Streptacidiphilus albus]|uniref:acyl-CoA carboxylase epsilon subunit n=1 Tax=Streptacidiphilus albus TaxID=105425 RepID=UPI00054B74A7|nr:acyl-CoA carboxylase epsilon subunit [Streptacidiphilus albus]
MTTDPDTHPTTPPTTPGAVRVVRGNPAPDELAALLAVLHAVTARSTPAPSREQRRPRAPWALGAARPGAGTWRTEPPAPAAVRRSTATTTSR